MEGVDWTPEGTRKRQFKFGANSLQPREDDVDQDDPSFSILFELGLFVSLLLYLIFQSFI
jgi:hypothetical protein